MTDPKEEALRITDWELCIRLGVIAPSKTDCPRLREKLTGLVNYWESKR